MIINDLLTKNDNINLKTKKLALTQVLNLTNLEISTKKDKKLTLKQQLKYKNIIKQLKKNKPIQYITKKAYFYNKEYKVNKNTLIPRPETEYLIKDTNDLIKKHLKKTNIKILDIGTGSGVIALTLKDLNNDYLITATDISKSALRVATHNDKYNRVNFKRTNLYDDINDKFDVVISNPPYLKISSKNIEEQVKKYEPDLALYAKDDGLYFYKMILKDIKRITNKKNIIAFEVGENQLDEVEKLAKEQFKDAKIIKKQDLNNFDRYIYIINE